MIIAVLLFLVPAVRPQAVICSSFGFQCSPDCRSIGYCVPSTSGGYQWRNSSYCGNQYCDPNSQLCSQNESGCSGPDTQVNIVCGTSGSYYPDPSDCRKSYYCDSDGSAILSAPCSPNYGYNACTKTCDIPLTNNQCNRRGNVCNRAGEIHLVPNNHQLFYVCSASSQGKLTPLMMSCLDHEVFDITRQLCVPRTGAGCTSDGGETDTSCSVTCTTSGIVANPCNCRGYYYCRSDLTSIAINCTSGYHFDSTTGGCAVGDCINT